MIGCEDPAVAIRVTDLYKGVQAPIAGHRPRLGRDDQVRVERVPRDQDLVRQRDRQHLCEPVDADVREVVLGMGYDQRIGFEFLHPGPGYGGSCFPKDTAALLHTADRAGYDFEVLRAVIESNTDQHDRMVEKVRAACGGSLDGRRVAVWGLTFKANTDDLRDSPAIVIVRHLLAEGCDDPCLRPACWRAAAALVPELEIVSDPYGVCADADVLTVLTEWDEFRWLDSRRVAELMQRPNIVDTRNLLDPGALRRLGFTYRGCRALMRESTSSPGAPASSASHLCRASARPGWDVVAVDNLVDRAAGQRRRARRP